MTEINEEVRASLTEAGIGPRYHDRTLASLPIYGDRLMLKLREHGDAIKYGGRSIVWHGVGLTESITLFCRGLHINGVGCFIRPLVRFRPIINDPEFRATVIDIPVLVILNGADTRRGNPFHENVMHDLEYLLTRRMDAGRATLIHLAVPEDVVVANIPNCYWSDEFLAVMDRYERIALSDLHTPEAAR